MLKIIYLYPVIVWKSYNQKPRILDFYQIMTLTIPKSFMIISLIS